MGKGSNLLARDRGGPRAALGRGGTARVLSNTEQTPARGLSAFVRGDPSRAAPEIYGSTGK